MTIQGLFGGVRKSVGLSVGRLRSALQSVLPRLRPSGAPVPRFLVSSKDRTITSTQLQAITLTALMVLLVWQHRQTPESDPIPTANLSAQSSKPVSFRNPAREIAQALRHTHNGKQIPASPVASIPERGSHDTSLEQPSLTINAKASEPNNISSHRGDLRLPGEAGLGPNLQATLKHNDTHRWMAKQPTIRTNHELGVSRPRWQSFDGVSLENRYGDQNASRFFTVMLDPGHGGSDPGATGHNGILEKEVTLDIARRTALLFSESDNIRIVMTRQIDRGMSRAARVAEIKASQADMVVSLHLNHLPQTDVTLVETFYAGPENIRESQSLQRQQASANGLIKSNTSPRVDLSFTQSSKILAQLVQRRVFGEVKLTNDTASSAGVKENTLFVLTRSFTPGALIEMTALSNIAEAERLATEDYRNRLAAALAKGIQDYINTEANDPNRSSI